MLAGVGLIACESSASPPVVETRGAVLAPTVLLTPKATPRGWFVSSVENYSRSDRMEQTLYARADDRDLRHAGGILVGEGGARLDLPHHGRAAKRIRDSALKFDQLIFEKNRCVHLSVDPRMRRQVLRQPGGPGSPVHQGLEA